MTAPASAHTDLGFGDLHGLEPAQRRYLALHAVPATDLPGQHQDRRHDTADHQQRRDNAQRLCPGGRVHHDHPVEDKHKIGDGNKGVGLGEQAIGYAPDQRDGDQHGGHVKGLFPKPLGKSAICVQAGLCGASIRQAAAVADRFGASIRPHDTAHFGALTNVQ